VLGQLGIARRLACGHRKCQLLRRCFADTDGYGNTNSHRDGNCYSYRNRDTDGHCYGYCHCNCNGYSYSYCYCYTNSYCHSHGYADVYRYNQPNTETDADSSTRADG
jgi:hypothetical protein